MLPPYAQPQVPPYAQPQVPPYAQPYAPPYAPPTYARQPQPPYGVAGPGSWGPSPWAPGPWAQSPLAPSPWGPGAWGNWWTVVDYTPPGKRHPPMPSRPALSTAGRTDPLMYTIGLLIGWPFFAAFVFVELAARIGVQLPLTYTAALLITSVVGAIGLTAACWAQARQRRADGWQDYRGPSPFLATAVVISCIEALGGLLSVVLTSMSGQISGIGILLVYSLCALGVYAGMSQLLVVREGALTWQEIARPEHLAPDPSDPPANPYANPYGYQIPKPSPLPGDIGWGAVLVLPVLVIVGMLASVLVQILGPDFRQALTPTPTNSSSLTRDDLLPILFAIAVLVPIGEEIFFRGVVGNAWGRSLSRRRAVLQTGLLFAFIHIVNVGAVGGNLLFQASFFTVALRIPVGLALSWVYLSRRSIYSSVVLHGAYNGLLLLLNW